MKALLLVLVTLCAALPSRLAAAGLPLLWVMEQLLPEDLLFVAKLGPVALSPTDLLILLLLVKLGVSAALRKTLVVDRWLYLALGAYLIVNLISTLVAGIKFGEPQLLRCATAFARFASEALVMAIVAQAVQTMSHAKLFIRIILGTLVLLAAIQFLNYVGASHGIVIGEVQGIERGEVRYFGPIGDSVGMVLLLGYLASLCFANLAGAVLFLGGILLTAGLGAMFAALVGTGLFLFIGTRTEAVRSFARRSLWSLPLLAFAAVIALTFFAKPLSKTLLDRVVSGTYRDSSEQRGVSTILAGAMILDNPLLGVGYMGYEQALTKYGGDRYYDLQSPDGGTANANNQILQALTDSGIFGLFAFAALVICAARLFNRIATRSEDRFLSTFFLAAFLWLLAQVFGNLAAVWLTPSSFVARLLWVSLGVAVAVARLLPASAQRPSPPNATPVEPQLLPA
jgi:O-antigen ligase